VQVKL